MIAVDTNVLVYGEAVDSGPIQQRAREAIEAALDEGPVVPAQVLAELFQVLSRKSRLPDAVARERVERYRRSVAVAPTTETVLASALDLAADHHLQTFDAIILAASAETGCRMLLSEDMQDGFVWRGVTVVNPFAEAPHPLLADLLRPRP
jgi:predicted nucleic acid-binding protein